MNKLDPFIVDLTPETILEPQTLFYLNKWLHDAYVKMGGGDDFIDEALTQPPIDASAIIDIEQRIGSGDALTSDETGFTVDLDTLSVDMTEA